MRLVFGTLLVIVAAVAIALIARADPGYVLIQFRGWTVEASLVLIMIALLLVFALLYVLIRLIVAARRLAPQFLKWRQRRRQARAMAMLARGFLDLLEGRWKRAEQRLTKYSDLESGAVLGYLGAARAAQEQKADHRRDRYLQMACESMPKAELALTLAQSEMQLAHGQYPQARATLDRLYGMAPKNSVVLAQLLRLHRELEEWDKLLRLLPALRRQGVIDSPDAERIERQAYMSVLDDPAIKDEKATKAIWRRVPARLKDDEELLHHYVRRLIDCGAGETAEDALNAALNKHWRPTLVYRYGLIEGGDPGKQLRRAEAWLQRHEGDAVLLLTLGRLSKRNSLWGKAKHYLETCVRMGGMPEALNELAFILEVMGEPEAALKYYRKAIVAMRHDTKGVESEAAGARRVLSPS